MNIFEEFINKLVFFYLDFFYINKINNLNIKK